MAGRAPAEEPVEAVSLHVTGEDDEGLTVAQIVQAGAVLGAVRFAAWDGHVRVVGPALDAASPGLAVGCMDALAARGLMEGLQRLTHVVASAEVLRWYAASRWAPGCVVAGEVGGRRCPYDPLRWTPLADPVDAVLTWDRSLEAVGGVARPGLEEVTAWFAAEDPFLALLAIRRMGLDGSLPPELVAEAHDRALLAHHAGVRQLGALAVCGFDDALVVTNGFHVAHGGITYSLADSALAFASNSHGHHALSIETSISHTSPVHAGDILVATATERQNGQRIARYDVDVRRNDKSVALFKGTVFKNGTPWT